MSQIMQTHAGVFRNGELLNEGIKKLDALAKDFSNVKVYMYVCCCFCCCFCLLLLIDDFFCIQNFF